uniref:Uncharacterized protein n=1 Tax=Rhizophora mucronata TaxID=61149 RepID=A0A2P2NJK9_RHIMU
MLALRENCPVITYSERVFPWTTGLCVPCIQSQFLIVEALWDHMKGVQTLLSTYILLYVLITLINKATIYYVLINDSCSTCEL